MWTINPYTGTEEECATTLPTFIQKLANQRVLSIVPSGDARVKVMEACDRYFFVVMTAGELRAWAAELIDYANMIERDVKNGGE